MACMLKPLHSSKLARKLNMHGTAFTKYNMSYFLNVHNQVQFIIAAERDGFVPLWIIFA
jgi:hypothetical protein